MAMQRIECYNVLNSLKVDIPDDIKMDRIITHDLQNAGKDLRLPEGSQQS